MPGTKHIDQYVKKKDKYGVKIGAWAAKHSPGIASCRYCFTTINCGKGKGPLISRSKSSKHRAKVPSIKSLTSN